MPEPSQMPSQVLDFANHRRADCSILSMVAAAPCGGGDPERASVRRPDTTAGEMLDCHPLYTSFEGMLPRQTTLT